MEPSGSAGISLNLRLNLPDVLLAPTLPEKADGSMEGMAPKKNDHEIPNTKQAIIVNF